MRVGIDASNLRQGGGVTHLVQLLAAADPPASGIDRVIVWGAGDLLGRLPPRPWLTVEEPSGLQSGAGRAVWQHRRLARAAAGRIDLLFVPGGSYLGPFRPFVTMFRNMLPFDPRELRQQGSARFRLKLRLLRLVQIATFRRADGVIFLNEHARRVIVEGVHGVSGRTAVIPHGLDRRFFVEPRAPRPFEQCSDSSPFRWLYVSAIYDYKRPWNVAEAAARLRTAGVPVALEFLGPGHPSSLRRLHASIDALDPARRFITVTPGVPHQDLPAHYAACDGFVFASTCENMPNSLLEAMAAGLPIACSSREPMASLAQDGAVYFEPEDPASIAAAMDLLMRDAPLRARLAARGRALAGSYDWTRCARQTFDFLANVTTGAACAS
jgi:glycosyltransferase involved in cell wall biosynthesis